MKISVITPTIRKDGLEIVRKALKRQTFKEFEWLIGSPFDPGIAEATWVKDDFIGGFWSLNRIYNKLMDKAQGELIISLQDWIYINPDGLEKAWETYRSSGGIVSGIGDQYEQLNEHGKPTIKIWNDPRKTTKYGTFYECTFPDVEWNYCFIPKDAISAIGGMDERLDFLGFGMDGYQVNERLNDAGYHFFLDQTNESYTLRHGREDYGGEEVWSKNNNLSNGEYQKRKEELKQKGDWPVLPNQAKSVI